MLSTETAALLGGSILEFYTFEEPPSEGRMEVFLGFLRRNLLRFRLVVDYPFFFEIRDDETGSISFMGTGAEPK